MALALYRKYRPATFAEVVGQEHVTEPLRTALAAGRINHAYLFSGPRGCGKTSSARIMARSLNCVQGPTADPCGECDSCRALAPEGPGSVDVTELDAASHGGVDDARELRDRAFYAPAEARYRVFVIDEAHMVTAQGFNALLKIVEEPPEHLIFIFATTEPDKVLTTIRSRTHHYPFRLIPPGSMRELLERNAAAEGVAVEPAVFPLVIRAGAGSARDTQSVLDQLLAGAGEEGVTYARAVALLGVTDVALIDDMVDGLSADDAGAVFGTVERLADAGHDPRRFASDLLDRLRDLILVRSVPDAAERGLVAAPEDELQRMVAQSERIGSATLSRYAEIVHNGLLEMRGATAPRLLLELLCARMLLPSATDNEAAVLQRLERLERRVTMGDEDREPEGAAGERTFQRPSQRTKAEPTAERAQPAAKPAEAAEAEPTAERVQPAAKAAEVAPAEPPQQPAEAAEAEPPAEAGPPAAEQPASEAEQPADAEPSAAAAGPPQRTAPPAQPAPAAAEAVASHEPAEPEPEPEPAPVGALDATAVRRVWPELLGAIRKSSRSTEAMLTNATVQSVDGSTVVLAHSAEPLARRLSEQRNVDVIATAMTEVLGGSWQVRCVHGSANGANGANEDKQASQPPSRRQSVAQQSATSRAQPERATSQQSPPSPPPRPPEPEEPGAAGAAEAVQRPPEPEPDYDDGSVSEPPAEPPWEDDEAAGHGSEPAHADPGEAAHQLLSEHLGARPLE